MELVAYLGSDRENWGQITALMNKMNECEKIILVKNKNVSGFPKNSRCCEISVNPALSLVELKQEIMNKISDRVSGDFEVAVSLASGTGKEHMALISALLSIPVGIRLVVFTKKGVEYIN